VFVHPNLRVPGSQLKLAWHSPTVCVGTRLFHHGRHWLLERTVDTGMNGVSGGPHSFSDLDSADDVALLAELFLLVSALEMMASDAASLGLEVNWQKTKVQALNSREDAPSTIKVQGQEVAVEFFLGSLPLNNSNLSQYLASPLQRHYRYSCDWLSISCHAIQYICNDWL